MMPETEIPLLVRMAPNPYIPMQGLYMTLQIIVRRRYVETPQRMCITWRLQHCAELISMSFFYPVF